MERNRIKEMTQRQISQITVALAKAQVNLRRKARVAKPGSQSGWMTKRIN